MIYSVERKPMKCNIAGFHQDTLNLLKAVDVYILEYPVFFLMAHKYTVRTFRLNFHHRDEYINCYNIKNNTTKIDFWQLCLYVENNDVLSMYQFFLHYFNFFIKLFYILNTKLDHYYITKDRFSYFRINQRRFDSQGMASVHVEDISS